MWGKASKSNYVGAHRADSKPKLARRDITEGNKASGKKTVNICALKVGLPDLFMSTHSDK